LELSDIGFLIIGAAKSATTSLQRLLQADPAVVMPDPELHYFSREYARGDDWYLAQFPEPGAAILIGEKSNSYMEVPAAVGRIAEKLPQVRLVAQLRDPVERAYSDYCMLYRRLEVSGDIAAALDPQVAAKGRFVAGGNYNRQLEPFFEKFGSDRMLVLLYEQFQADPAGQLAQLRAFLRLDPSVAPPDLGRRVKDRSAPMVPPRFRRTLRAVKPLVAPLRGSPLLNRARALVAREMRYPPLAPSLRARLAEHYVPEIERLEKLLGRDLSIWSGPPGATREIGYTNGL
jgi:hypothetical protein